MSNQYKNSITLDELIDKLQIYKTFHRNEGGLPIYFDALAINGNIDNHKDYLELW